MEEQKNIVIISDGTGKTAKRLMDAVLVQYSQPDLEFEVVNIYQEVRSQKQIDQVLAEIDDEYLVIYSIISLKLAKYLRDHLNERNILYLDVLRPMLQVTSKFLGVHPDYKPGILHVVSGRYYKKVDAIGYTVEHDDGRGTNIEQAEIVLLGLSRVCKTPVSMYLACNYGYRVANIPVVRNATMAKNLLQRLERVPHKRIVGLLMRPDTLAYVREERARVLTESGSRMADLQEYCDRREITQEYRFCRDLFEVRHYTTVDTTRRAIEEVAAEILDRLGLEQDVL